MARPSVDEDKEVFLRHLQGQGGYAGNVTLRNSLSWTEDRYWRTHGLLADQGIIIRGRGKGGSVTFVQPEEVEPVSVSTHEAPPLRDVSIQREIDLYETTKQTIEHTWVKEKAYDDYLVEITALPGRRQTGGTWTRPDIAVLATKAYPYLPDRTFEIITFEIKTTTTINVTGLFEALSHAQFASQSYVVFWTDGKDFDKDISDSARILALASRHGVGVIIATDLSQHASWDERVRPQRNVPDPEQANLFISTCFSEAAKQRVIKWHK